MRYYSGKTYRVSYPNPDGYVFITIYSDNDIAQILEDRVSKNRGQNG